MRTLIFALCLLMGGIAYADDGLLRAVIGEAEGEGLTGQIAVCEVYKRNQVMYGQKAIKERNGAYYRGKRRIDERIVRQAQEAIMQCEAGSNLTMGSTHFENVESFGRPYWAEDMKEVVKIGSHTFYKKG